MDKEEKFVTLQTELQTCRFCKSFIPIYTLTGTKLGKHNIARFVFCVQIFFMRDNQLTYHPIDQATNRQTDIRVNREITLPLLHRCCKKKCRASFGYGYDIFNGTKQFDKNCLQKPYLGMLIMFTSTQNY